MGLLGVALLAAGSCSVVLRASRDDGTSQIDVMSRRIDQMQKQLDWQQSLIDLELHALARMIPDPDDPDPDDDTQQPVPQGTPDGHKRNL